MAHAINTDKLTRRYGAHIALNSLSMDVEEGEIFGFLGHNGAGKTTTINILTTLLAPSSGHAAVFGHDVVQDSFALRQLIGYVPENVRLYETMSSFDNLQFFAKLSGVEKPAQRIAETLTFLECPELGPRLAGTLSKGLRQRIGLAQAILHRPKVLFLDEPTSGLDPLGIKTLRDLIVRLNRQDGTTIFMNTHLLGEVARTCTSIAVLNHGNLVYQDNIGAVMKRFGDEAALESLYLSLAPKAAA
jgi:ABC-2 type transport system ATP-binding protein